MNPTDPIEPPSKTSLQSLIDRYGKRTDEGWLSVNIDEDHVETTAGIDLVAAVLDQIYVPLTLEVLTQLDRIATALESSHSLAVRGHGGDI
jgi:hypothetical protein